MAASHLKVIVNGNDLSASITALALAPLEASVTHQLNRHPECRIQYHQPPSSRYFYEQDIGKSFVVFVIDGSGAETEVFQGLLRQVDAEWRPNGSCVLT